MNSFALYARSSVLMLVALMNDDQTHTKRRGKKNYYSAREKRKPPNEEETLFCVMSFPKKKKASHGLLVESLNKQSLLRIWKKKKTKELDELSTLLVRNDGVAAVVDRFCII